MRVSTFITAAVIFSAVNVQSSIGGILGNDNAPTLPQQPVNPLPINPQPITPQPITPQPISPQPISPQPISPQPISPQPGAAQPGIPGQVSSISRTPIKRRRSLSLPDKKSEVLYQGTGKDSPSEESPEARKRALEYLKLKKRHYARGLFAREGN
ncbi:hypothetical protein ABW20_dc0106345 [Dactylellina cionopaga]|nr:hypothetical protein ABW20_dc0106345 [Dactylellina cionopaga]